jgi:hypothetical protein
VTVQGLDASELALLTGLTAGQWGDPALLGGALERLDRMARLIPVARRAVLDAVIVVNRNSVGFTPGRCFNCTSPMLVIEPDPGMGGVTDRVRCIVCGETQADDELEGMTGG